MQSVLEDSMKFDLQSFPPTKGTSISTKNNSEYCLMDLNDWFVELSHFGENYFLYRRTFRNEQIII